LTVAFLLAGIIFLAAFASLVMSSFNDFYMKVSIAIFFGSGFTFIVLLFSCLIYQQVTENRNVRNRKEVNIDKFVSATHVLQEFNRFHVKAAREVIGVVYGVKQEIIYDVDTAESLKKLCSITPYGFEVVLGIAKRLGIILEDAEVDQIVERINENSKNVKELVSILCEEIASAEESQERKDFETLLLATDVTDTACASKVKKRYIGFPAFVALLCLIGAVSGTLENEENFFSKSNLIIVFQITFVGYVIGLVIKILVKRWLNSLDKDSDGETIDIDMIMDYCDRFSPDYYIQQCLTDMYKSMDKQRTFRKYEELPCFSEIEGSQRPWFAEFANRLKSIAGLENIPYTSPKQGLAELQYIFKKEPKKIRLHVEILDGIKDGYITLRIEPLNE
jgi:hypothetical protein